MAITKQAKNIQIKIIDTYQLIVGNKLEKNTNKLNFEAMKENLILVTDKKIIICGEEK